MCTATWIVLCISLVTGICVSGQYLKTVPSNRLLFKADASLKDNPLGYLPPSDINAEGDNPLQTGVLLKSNEEEEDGKYHHDEDHTHWDIRKSVPGEPGQDYPVYDSIPATSFTCEMKSEGYYADVEAGCQVFHICSSMPAIKKSFLCPNGSIFNQELSICDWWTQVNCKGSSNFDQQTNNFKTNTNGIMMQEPIKLIPTDEANIKGNDRPDIDIRFGGAESSKLDVDLLPPYNAVKVGNSDEQNTKGNKLIIATTTQSFITGKPNKKFNLSFLQPDNRILNTLDSRVTQKYSTQEPSRFYLNSIPSTSITDYFNAESKTNLKSNSLVTTPTYSTPRYTTPTYTSRQYISPEYSQVNSELQGEAYISPENIQEKSELRGSTYIPPEYVQGNSQLQGNLYIPPENVQDNSELNKNIYLPPENVQDNSQQKENIYLPPENVQENSQLKENTYLPPENVQDNSELKENTYLPPENIQENSELKENTYLPPEYVQDNSELKENTYLPPENIQENSELKENTNLPLEDVHKNSKRHRNSYSPSNIVQENSDLHENSQINSENNLKNSGAQKTSNILPRNDPQESIKLLKQFSSMYESRTEGNNFNKDSVTLSIPNQNFPSTRNQILTKAPTINPTTQNFFSRSSVIDTPNYSQVPSNELSVTKRTQIHNLKTSSISPEFSSTTYSPPTSTSYTTEGFKLINIHAVNRDKFTKNTQHYQSTISSPYSFQTTDFTGDVNYVTPSSPIIVDTVHTSTGITPIESHSTTINMINDLTSPKVNRLTPKLTFSDNAEQKKELKISLIRDSDDYQDSSTVTTHSNGTDISTSTETNTQNDKPSTGLKFSLFKGFSTPRPFENNANIVSSYLTSNLHPSSSPDIVQSVTRKVDFKPLDILNINHLQHSTLTPLFESSSHVPQLVQSISFNLDSEEGRKEFDLAVSSGLFSES